MIKSPFKFILILSGIFHAHVLFAQTGAPVFRDAADLTLVGKAAVTKNRYHRLDTALYPGMPAAVKRLATNTAGIAISFKTNSTSISAKWCVSDSKGSANLTAIANKGLDLYIKKNGKWQFAGVGRPSGKCNQDILVRNMNNEEKECLLYLPLYDQLSNLEIGTDPNSSLTAGSDPFKRRIIIYGSSIVQGASASRPGMAYPARMSRETSLNFINLGFSGSAKMEKEVADIVSSLPADAYILDCVPNSSPSQITERTAYLVSSIRKAHPKAPVIIIQTIVREHGFWDQKTGTTVVEQNLAIKKEYEKLLKQGVKDLYLIESKNLLGTDHDGTVDGTHPNDIGFDRMISSFQPQILSILAKYNIDPGKKGN